MPAAAAPKSPRTTGPDTAGDLELTFLTSLFAELCGSPPAAAREGGPDRTRRTAAAGGPPERE